MFSLQARTNQRILSLGLGLAAALIASSAARAVVVIQLQDGSTGLHSGWEAVIDDSLANLVDIGDITVMPGAAGGQGAVFFQKSAEFTQGPVNGLFPSIPIVFRQKTGFTGQAMQNLVISDEIITNSTGTAWTDFHFDLLNHGEVWFDVARTATSGGPVGGTPGVNQQLGFSTAPFANSFFSNFIGGDPDKPMRFNMDNGIVANGDSFFPGDGATDGQLWMHVSNLTGNVTFVLKETPTPAPGAIALIALAGVFGSSRRRRHG